MLKKIISSEYVKRDKFPKHTIAVIAKKTSDSEYDRATGDRLFKIKNKEYFKKTGKEIEYMTFGSVKNVVEDFASAWKNGTILLIVLARKVTNIEFEMLWDYQKENPCTVYLQEFQSKDPFDWVIESLGG